jgi:hypothetical protein
MPVKKKKATKEPDLPSGTSKKPAARKASSSTKPASSKKAFGKKTAGSDDNDSDIDYDLPPRAAPKRAARAPPKQYIDLTSEDDERRDPGDDSLFEDD